MVQAWMKDDSEKDQALPHKQSPNVEVSLKVLENLGVKYKKMNPDKYANGERYHEDPELKYYTNERDFAFSDILNITRETLPDYDEMLKCFYAEHFHQDDEVRYVIEGSGYFDFRDEHDEWIRMFIEKGDLFILPAGIYHRFTMDKNNYLKAIRLFIKDPIWLAVNRPADDHFIRKKYVKEHLSK